MVKFFVANSTQESGANNVDDQKEHHEEEETISVDNKVLCNNCVKQRRFATLMYVCTHA